MEALFFIICALVILFPHRAERLGDRALRARRHPWMWTDEEWNDPDYR